MSGSLKTFRFLRALVRRRQESAAVAAERQIAFERQRESLTALNRAGENIERRDRQIEELRQIIENREKTIFDLQKVEIPKLEAQIKVAEHECEMLAALRERELTRFEAEAARNNRFTAEAETWVKRMMGDRE